MKHLLVLILGLCSLQLAAQNTFFKVIGKNCHYNEKEIIVEKVLFTDSAYSSVCRINNIRPEMPINVLAVGNCTFSFEGEISMPTPFTATCPDDEPANESEIFFLESGENGIEFGDLKQSVNVKTTTPSNKELEAIVQLLGSSAFRFLGPNQVEKNLSLMSSYIQSNPDSYVAMWLMIIMVERAKTEERYANLAVLQTCDLFSEEMRQNPILRYFRGKFETYQLLNQANARLPFEKLILGERIKETAQKNEYVLIDFWSTGCKPCIEQLPELQTIYQQYHTKGFTIFSISTDPTKEREEMANAILQKNGCLWENYFDGQQQDYNTLIIPHLPNNLLIDKTGEIIQRDMSLDALSKFLAENLHQNLLKK